MLVLTFLKDDLNVYDSETGKVFEFNRRKKNFNVVIKRIMSSDKRFMVYNLYKLVSFIGHNNLETGSLISFSKRVLDVALLARNAKNTKLVDNVSLPRMIKSLARESLTYDNNGYRLYCVYMALAKMDAAVMLPVDAIEIAQAACQYMMVSNGLRVDMEKQSKLKNEFEEEIEAISDSLDVLGIRDRDGISNIVSVLESRLDIKLKGGLPSVSDCRVDKTIPDFVLVYHHRERLTELVSKFLCFDDVIHSTISPYTKFSGRSSSNPNLYEFPNDGDVRNIIVPREGCVFVTADYSYAGLVALAQTCLTKFGSSELAKSINAGVSPHDSMMEHLSKELPNVKVTRKLAKLVNFAFPTGMSGRSLVGYARKQGVVITEAEGIQLYDKWLSSCVSLKRFVNVGDSVVSINGRKYIGTKNEARSFLFQSVVSDCVNLAMVLLSKAGFRIVNNINDEFLIEVTKENAHEDAMTISDIMKKAYLYFCKDVPVSVDIALTNCWDKGAKPVYRDGKLVVWEKDRLEEDTPADLVWCRFFGSVFIIDYKEVIDKGDIIAKVNDGESLDDLKRHNSRISQLLKKEGDGK